MGTVPAHASEPKRVFISYAWEDDKYKAWVKALATQLRESGIRARLDQWHVKAGANIPGFMNSEVRKADFVLVIGSPTYKQKVEEQEDGGKVTGSGWETRVVTTQIFSVEGFNPIPVLARGTWQESMPSFISNQLGFDLSNTDTYATNFNKLVEAITGTSEKAPPIGPPRIPGSTPDGDPVLTFQVRTDVPNHYQVELASDGRKLATGAFDLDPDHCDSLLPPKLKLVRENSCEVDDIYHLGGELWDRLRDGDVYQEVAKALSDLQLDKDRILKLQIVVPHELQGIPWESMWELNYKTIATSPRVSLSRGIDRADQMPAPVINLEKMQTIRVLVVIPRGSGLVTSAEWEKIQQVIQDSDQNILLDQLVGEVTPNDLADKLQSGWDIVHFIGHGRIGKSGSVELRFNADADNQDTGDSQQWFPADLFAQMFQVKTPRLVVLNCCHGAAAGAETASGLGELMMRSLVPASVLMQYEIQDTVAAKFTGIFYQELLSGERLGRVDVAMQKARAVLARTYRMGKQIRAFITPVLYLQANCHQLFCFEQVREAKIATVGEIDPRIDPDLIEAMRRGMCLPILGPEVLSAGAHRDDAQPPGPSDLIHTLAKQSEFPGLEQIVPLSGTSAGWLTPVLFERVCQHFESGKQRYLLEDIISETYRRLRAPAILDKLGAWNVRGLVYTYIDGLLENVLQKQWGGDLRVAQSEDITTPLPAGNDKVLINLRGTFTTPTSMILTEDDRDGLLDEKIRHVAGFVENLMNSGGGGTLLFVGVSPRDTLVRSISRRILRDEVKKRRGIAYFVSDQLNEADKYYWSQLPKIKMLDIDSGALIEGLTIASEQGKADNS